MSTTTAKYDWFLCVQKCMRKRQLVCQCAYLPNIVEVKAYLKVDMCFNTSPSLSLSAKFHTIVMAEFTLSCT